MRFSLFFLIAGILFIGCAPNARYVDLGKSCEALTYENSEVSFQIDKDKEAMEKAKKEGVPAHMFVVSIGAMASAATFISPAGNIIAINGASAYILPALTVGYYNKFTAPKDIIERYDYLEERRKTINRLLEEKNCKNPA